jgi:hypothetical protein
MSIVRKMLVICDRCGKHQEIRWDEDDPFSEFALADERRDGWFAPDHDHHLCPGCASAYKRKEDEMRRELKRLAGIKTIEVDV